MHPNNITVIVCDLHSRITGVSTTIRAQLQLLGSIQNIAFLAKTDHDHCKAISLYSAYTICRSALPKDTPFRIWHARRNNEMMWGLIFKYIFRCKIQLLFTSAAKRRHSWFPRKLIASMDKIIATTDEAASFVPNVEAIIGHGVDHTVFKPAINKSMLKRHLQIHAEINVGIIGRIRPEKGTDIFIKAMIQVFKKHPNINAYLFGLISSNNKLFSEKLKNEINEAKLNDRFIWMGVIDIDKMPSYQACMDITIAPARYEGYGMVPLEAMACKNAVLATDTGAYSSMIKHGESGYIINDKDDLILKMNELLDNPSKIIQMGECGLKRIRGDFTLEQEVLKINTVYKTFWQQKG